jgi:hypothetical protein
MTTKTTKISVFILAIIMGSGIAVSTGLNSAVFGQTNSTSSSPQNANFTATLSGQNEVPPTQSIATGNAVFTQAGQNMTFFLNATDLQNYTAAHIHLAPQGQNGPIVVTLVNFTAPVDQYSLDGNSIAAQNLEGPLKGKQISDLVNEMNNGNTYVNIHTTQNPNGEIRGQIVSSNQ